MSAYRYWRIVITAQPDENYAVLAEIELHTSVGGADVTGSGTASASSEFSSAYAAAKAFANDGGSTYWRSGSSPKPHWIQYDFGAGAAQENVEYVLTGSGTNTYSPTAWCIAVSQDGLYWTVVNVRDSQSWTAGETKTLAMDTPLVARAFSPSVTTVIDASHYWIHHTVDRLGVPGRYPVRLYDRTSGALLRESKSAEADGAYQFEFLPYLERGYQVIALDDPATRSDPKNAAIADLMTPEAMP